jgi:hypothetical protein
LHRQNPKLEATMKAVLAYPRIAAGLVAGIVIGLFASGVAYAVTSNVFRYSATQTGAVSINYSALIPDHGSNTYSTAFETGFLVAQSTDCFRTGASFPDGAKLTKLTVWYTSTAPASVGIFLFRNRHTGAATEFFPTGSSTDTSGTLVEQTFTLSGASATINNNVFSYGFAVCFENTTSKFRSARLTYTYRDAGD